MGMVERLIRGEGPAERNGTVATVATVAVATALCPPSCSKAVEAASCGDGAGEQAVITTADQFATVSLRSCNGQFCNLAKCLINWWVMKDSNLRPAD